MDKWFGEKRLWLFGNHLPLLPRRFVVFENNVFNRFKFIIKRNYGFRNKINAIEYEI